ncbi:putative carboxylesterase 2 [Silene latifolia]|uniref:putative carboxylesterase 2 n=1 Tax=Silene latifolia TaxID=37657 RepID=UPI003D77273D
MDSTTTKPQISYDMSPYLIEYTDGTIQRLAGSERVHPGFDSRTGVTSKDILINPKLPARIYTPTITSYTNHKLPIVIYFHGGAYVIASPAFPLYHTFCNNLVASANVILVSVDYRLAPEHPLPAAYDDAWDATQWVAAHADGDGPEQWLNEGVDYNKIFLSGDSAGSTLAHHVSCRVTKSCFDEKVSIEGMILIHPYFWGKDPIGSEINDPRKEMVDRWWLYVCPTDKGCDDPLINPFSDEAPRLETITCNRVIVLVAEKDILSERGKYYYEGVTKSGWNGKAEYYVSEGQDHVFHIFDPDCKKAVDMKTTIASFINQEID